MTISAIIVKNVKGVPQPVGNVDIGEGGFDFESVDITLSRLLSQIQKYGVPQWTAPEHLEPEMNGSTIDLTLIDEQNAPTLRRYLEDFGYGWWDGSES
jgi:hypothetical protein